MLKKIALIYGGTSKENEVSIKSMNNILRKFISSKYELIPVCINENGFFITHNNKNEILNLNTFSNDTYKFDGAFLIVHGTPFEDGKLQGILEFFKIPYVGSNTLSSALTFSKFYCTNYISNFNIKTAKSILIQKNNFEKTQIKWDIFPAFVKPNNGGSSICAYKIKSISELHKRLDEIFLIDNEAILEEFIQGSEVTCGVFKDKNGVKVLPITEIKTNNEFFDFNAKYNNQSQEITPARLTEEMTNKIKEITKIIFIKLNCNGFARADFIIKDQIPYFIEINTIPGFTEKSLIPQQLECEGIEISNFIESLIDFSIEIK